VLYRRAGVGLAKRIVETRMWPLLCGNLPQSPMPKNRQEFLERTEETARGAEICHAATFALAALVSVIYLAVGNFSAAVWIVIFNVVLNGYPVMLQRCHRWRIQQLRA
jgi:Glycosyl-4,4'-diaponeurosporenoate acyltransferase